MRRFAVGLDSFDSVYVGCTTHFTVFLIRKVLSAHGLFLYDLPHLVRLNQFIPWKTRGNASTGLILETDRPASKKGVLEIIVKSANYYGGDIINGEPGIAVLDLDEAPEDLKLALHNLYKKSLVDVVTDRYVNRLLKDNRYLITWGERGVIGALAALGFMLGKSRWTFELIAYRRPENMWKRRMIDDESVREIEANGNGKLFNNYNYREKRNVASPRGYDPILIGLRGSDPHLLIRAVNNLRLNEVPESWMLFVTNQHLDEHVLPVDVNRLRAYNSGLVEGVIESSPDILKKGHVRARIRDATGAVDVFFFSPSAPLNKIAMSLRKGDYVGVLGGGKPSGNGIIFEAHKLWVYESPPEIYLANPPCPVCGSRLKSEGKVGMKCSRCGYRTSDKYKVPILLKDRDLRGSYTPEPGRINHLVKPSWRGYDFEIMQYRPKELLDALLRLSPS